MTAEAELRKADDTDKSPATHRQVGSGGWRKGTSGYAELNPGHGNPRLRQEWIATDWKNADLDRHPFRRIE